LIIIENQYFKQITKFVIDDYAVKSPNR